jgi:hypothetical protein
MVMRTNTLPSLRKSARVVLRSMRGHLDTGAFCLSGIARSHGVYAYILRARQHCRMSMIAPNMPTKEEVVMALYELRTYTLFLGKMTEVVRLYSEFGYPAQLVHLWKFDDDADRRRHWQSVYANADFTSFLAKLRPLLMTQEVKLLLAAPRGPHP